MDKNRKTFTPRNKLIPFLFILVFLGSGCISVDLRSLMQPKLEERVIEGHKRWIRNKVLIIDIGGQIASETYDNLFFLTRCSPEKIKAILNKAEQDNRIQAVILRIDSPGGEVTATDMIYHDIIDFKKRTGIPVVASIMGLGCSGAYYIACAADKVYAHPTSITGSIGIIARFPKLTKLANKIGYDEEILTTGDFKAMGHPLREMSPNTRHLLQRNIEDLFDQFLGVVMNSRKDFNTREKVKTISDGRIFTARQALDLKVIDEIAYLSEVIDETKLSSGFKDLKVVTYNSLGKRDLNIYSKSPIRSQMPVNVINFDLSSLLPGDAPGFYYLWRPGK